ncbi:hypothetical protein SAMN05216559_2065 [Halomicrobium zhouii]|uniref:Uncharacterized protein n=1 Tax=Halomicrobium zhouii TaxID=767519 RepID=A0A1I6L551_9EURY|nr:hypothetical protein [Halomicrobium zhouii]SFR98611.1 hypothetical protein SAMN05216559_2065 [Halomicrobium zhouii]
MDHARAEERGLLGLEARAVGAGLVSGFAAGLPMGFLLQFGTDLLPVLATIAGVSSVAVGWVVHLAIAAVYGALFAVIVAYPAVQGFIAEFGVREYTLLGITYGITIAAVSISILPFIFELPWVANAAAEQLALVSGPSFGGLVPAGVFAAGHVVYGAVLGAGYATVKERSPALAG